MSARFESLEVRTLFANPTDLDVSFSGDGKVITDFGGANDVAHAVAVQLDGKVVVAGETQVTVGGVKKTAFAAVRFNADGSLDDGSVKDTSKGDKFGAGGKFVRVVDKGGGTGALGVAIQKDGKIILAGNALSSAAGVDPHQWFFLRLNKDGTLDSGYGKSGVASTSFGGDEKPQLRAILLQPDGKLLAAGSLDTDFHLTRLTTSGKIDQGFGSNGNEGADFGGIDVATALTFDYRGYITVVGNVGGNGTKQDVGIAKYDIDGNRVTQFGTQGRAVYSSMAKSSDVGGVAALPDGNIYVSYARVLDPIQAIVSTGDAVAGTVVFDDLGHSLGSSSQGPRTSANGLSNTPTDFLAVGGTTTKGSAAESFYVSSARFEFEKIVGFGASTDHNVANAMTVGPDGHLVQVGYTTAGGGGRNFAIVRYVGSPLKGLGKITGKVFTDADQDSVLDGNEQTINNYRVFIDVDNNGVWDPKTERSVLASNEGDYKFAVAPGTYRLRLELTNPFTFPLPAVRTVNVAARQAVGGVNFGIAEVSFDTPPTQITGSVFFDFDGDGLRDVDAPVEPDLVGRTVFLDTNGNNKLDPGEPQAKTDGGGNYKFVNLTPGNYRVGDVLPAGWTHTDPTTGFFDVSVAANQVYVRRFATTFADPDDTISEVNNIPSNQISVGGSVNFSIANVTDVDLVRFAAKKGQKIGFDIDRPIGSSLNSYVRLFDANGNQLAFNDDAAAPGETKGADSYLAFTFNAAGNYYIGVSNNANKAYEPRFGYGDNGVGTTGGYKLSLVNISTASAVAFSKVAVGSLFTDVSGPTSEAEVPDPLPTF
jgi:uncharacterized delta-60 repeat protein